MKATVAHEVEIHRSAEDVFDYCSDHTNEPRWNPHMERCENLTKGPVGVGTRFSMVIADKAMIGECVRFDRPNTWAVVGEMPMGKAGLEGRVIPTARGARLAMRMWIEPRGLAGLAAPLIRFRLKAAWRRDLANIKSILERLLINDVEPDREFVQRVSIHVNASPHKTMQALREVTLRDMPLASLLGELRYLPQRIMGRGQKRDVSRPFIDQVFDGGSVLVAERESESSEEIVIGGIGKYHQIVDQQPVRLPDVAHYRAFDDSHYQKLAMELATVASDGGCDLLLEAHTHPLGRLSKKAFARYWVVIDPMGRFVSWLLLRAGRRRAEGHERRPTGQFMPAPPS
jgi:uncharacterized protein YndB with AHSA1/START domain